MASQADTDMIHDFFETSYTNSKDCFRCGAKIDWDWITVKNIILHIKWHKNLEAFMYHMEPPYPEVGI